MFSMVTTYPAKIDNTTSLPTVIDNSSPVQALTVNRLRDAILAIEDELGVKPSSVYGTVRHRLDVLEAGLNNLQIIKLNGDLGGSLDTPLVIGLQGRPLSDVTPTLNQALVWSGIAWTPQTISGGGGGSQNLANVLSLGNNADGYLITNLSDPIGGQDAATKAYVDAHTFAAPNFKSVLSIGNITDGYNVIISTGDVITIIDAPVNPTDGVNKSYVDGYNFTASVTLTGDVTGPANNNLISKIQGNNVDNTLLGSIQDGYVATWNNSLSKIKFQLQRVAPPTQDGQLLYSSGGLWIPLNKPSSDGYLLTTANGIPAWLSGGVSKMDTTNNPLFLYNFEDNMNDSSGNGYHLSVESGTEQYIFGLSGLKGFYFDGLTRLVGPAAGSSAGLRITGDITLIAIVQYNNTNGGAVSIVSFAATGDSEAANYLYSWSNNQTSSPLVAPQWLQENGAGIDSNYTLSPARSFAFIHNVVWLAARRMSNVIQYFVNGRPFGAPSSALTTPTGGTNGQLRINGDPGTNGTQTCILSVKGIASALSDLEMANEYNRTLGRAFGIYTP